MFSSDANKNQPNQLVYVTQSVPVSTISLIPTPINTVATTTNTSAMLSSLPTPITITPITAPTPIIGAPLSAPSTPINRTPQTKFQTSENRNANRRGGALNKTPVISRTPSTSLEGRRSSSRSIKRKRFDDEIVEYSINYPQVREQHRVGRPRGISHSYTSTSTISSSSSSGTTSTPSIPGITPATAPPTTTSNVVMGQSGTPTLPYVGFLSSNVPTPVSSKTTLTKSQQQQQQKQQQIQATKPQLITADTPNANSNFLNKIIEMPKAMQMPTMAGAMPIKTITTAAHVTTDLKKINDTTASLVAGHTQNLTPNSSTVSSTIIPRVNAPTATLANAMSRQSATTTLSTATAATITTNAMTTRTTTIAGGRRITSRARQTADRRRTPRGNRRRKAGGGRLSNQAAIRDLGRWKPIDDLALVIGVQQTRDLRVVHRSSKFSCRFTLSEIQARWYSLLYEPAISRTAIAAMRNLHPEMIASVQRKALFSIREEEILSYIKSSENPKLEQFEELLQKNSADFHSQRTAKTLLAHWQMMRQYQLLCDQMPRPAQYNDQAISFSDAEDQMVDTDLNDPRDETLEIELTLNDRSEKRHIRIMDSELSRWNVLIDSTSGTNNSTPEFDSQTLAVLRGRMVRYLMRSKEITFGRDAKDQNIDVDLSLEGPASKISRRQGTIKLRSNGDFFISNEGKRPIFINGIPLAPDNKTRLANNFVVEICGLRLVFMTNYELINAIRHESAKTAAALN